eukprot:Unigene12937_Nuclearia_a/m.39242 Unigene12937_Nuclearia_a/g.39242  ORF Unigene12937_Nuclearia_a/g.39242 Unigene12937_Nuclearia_a/m.39242 type:complete len:304 (+) Unigene12937_Nuclearia_a:112-1023(+)
MNGRPNSSRSSSCGSSSPLPRTAETRASSMRGGRMMPRVPSERTSLSSARVETNSASIAHRKSGPRRCSSLGRRLRTALRPCEPLIGRASTRNDGSSRGARSVRPTNAVHTSRRTKHSVAGTFHVARASALCSASGVTRKSLNRYHSSPGAGSDRLRAWYAGGTRTCETRCGRSLPFCTCAITLTSMYSLFSSGASPSSAATSAGVSAGVSASASTSGDSTASASKRAARLARARGCCSLMLNAGCAPASLSPAGAPAGATVKPVGRRSGSAMPSLSVPDDDGGMMLTSSTGDSTVARLRCET